MSSLPPNVPLFRPEAMTGRVGSVFGTTLLPQIELLTFASYVSAAFVLIMALVLCFASYSPRITATGWLEYAPKDVSVSSPVAGRVNSVYVTSGERVEKDQILASISPSRSTTSLRDVNGVVLASIAEERKLLESQIAAERQLSVSSAQEVQRSIRAAKAGVRSLEGLLARCRERLDLALSTEERVASLVRQGYLPQADLQKAKDGSIAAKVAELELEQKLSEQRAHLNNQLALAADQDVLAQRKRVELQANLTRLAQKEVETRGTLESVARSPFSGTVTNLTAKVGQSVDLNEELLVVIPDDAKLYAKLLVPTSASAFLHVGDKVNIRVDALPFEQFGQIEGRITDIDKAVSRVAGGMVGPAAMPAYQVSVAFDPVEDTANGNKISLTGGMTISGDVFQAPRRLISFIFAPLTGLVKQL